MMIRKDVVEVHCTRYDDFNKEKDTLVRQGYSMQNYWMDREGGSHAVMVKVKS